MLTFLSSPKHFVGENSRIQQLAIQSWLNTHPSAQVLLYGEAIGSEDLFRGSERVTLVPRIATSVSGVPLFNDIAAHAGQYAKYDLQVYVNCDILFAPDFAHRLEKVPQKRFLGVGQRIDCARNLPFDLRSNDWTEAVRRFAKESLVTLHSVKAMDYFVFSRGMWDQLPCLIVGRGGYDGALIAYCLRREITVVDLTFTILALHQFHDYTHVRGGMAEAHRGQEAQANYTLHDVLHSTPNSADADLILKGSILVPFKCRGDSLRAVELALRYKKGLKIASYAVRAWWRFLQAIRCGTNVELSLDDVLTQLSEESLPIRNQIDADN